MRLVIRSDASAEIGAGHVMRCLALAQAWQDSGGRAAFLMAGKTPAMEERIKSEGIEVLHIADRPGSAEDARKTAGLARESGAAWVVVDGYHFGADYQQIIKDAGLRLLFIDDNGHAGHYYADLVLNQNIHANEGVYTNREPYTQLLLGTQYVLLRREFRKWSGWKREVSDIARRVLVTLGGGDSLNLTLKVLSALRRAKVDGLEAIVLLGPANAHHEKLQSTMVDSQFPVRVICDATNMPELMMWADIAVSGGGSTCWEMAFMGLPSVIAVVAENQRASANELSKRGVALLWGWFEQATETDLAEKLSDLHHDIGWRDMMIRTGRELVDGGGCERVMSALQFQWRSDLLGVCAHPSGNRLG